MATYGSLADRPFMARHNHPATANIGWLVDLSYQPAKCAEKEREAVNTERRDAKNKPDGKDRDEDLSLREAPNQPKHANESEYQRSKAEGAKLSKKLTHRREG